MEANLDEFWRAHRAWIESQIEIVPSSFFWRHKPVIFRGEDGRKKKKPPINENQKSLF